MCAQIEEKSHECSETNQATVNTICFRELRQSIAAAVAPSKFFGTFYSINVRFHVPPVDICHFTVLFYSCYVCVCLVVCLFAWLFVVVMWWWLTWTTQFIRTTNNCVGITIIVNMLFGVSTSLCGSHITNINVVRRNQSSHFKINWKQFSIVQNRHRHTRTQNKYETNVVRRRSAIKDERSAATRR